MLDSASPANVTELLELSRSRHGDAVAMFEKGCTEIVASVLAMTGVAARWQRAGLSSQQLAEHLLMTASGIKASGASRADFANRMRVATALVARGAPRR
jgi:hypothetical protein